MNKRSFCSSFPSAAAAADVAESVQFYCSCFVCASFVWYNRLKPHKQHQQLYRSVSRTIEFLRFFLQFVEVFPITTEYFLRKNPFKFLLNFWANRIWIIQLHWFGERRSEGKLFFSNKVIHLYFQCIFFAVYHFCNQLKKCKTNRIVGKMQSFSKCPKKNASKVFRIKNCLTSEWSGDFFYRYR